MKIFIIHQVAYDFVIKSYRLSRKHPNYNVDPIQCRKLEGPFCKCGRRKKYHYDVAYQASDSESKETEWSCDRDTQLVSTNANGKLFNFRYLRLDSDVDFNVIQQSFETEFPSVVNADLVVTILGDNLEAQRARQRNHLRALLVAVQNYNGLIVLDHGAFKTLRKLLIAESSLSNLFAVLNWSSLDVDTREEMVFSSGADRRLAESPSVLDSEDCSNSDLLFDERDFLMDCSGTVLLVDSARLGLTYSHTYEVSSASFPFARENGNFRGEFLLLFRSSTASEVD